MQVDFSDPRQANLTPQQAYALLQEWYKKKEELATLKTQEIMMRKGLAEFYFPDPVEGTQALPMGETHELVLEQGYTRKVDADLLRNIGQKLFEDGIPLDLLIRWTPELNVREYRKLNDAQRKVFDQLITTKPDSPQLNIREKAQQAAAPAQQAPGGTVQPPNMATAPQGGPEGESLTPVPDDDDPTLPKVTLDDPDKGRKGDYFFDDEGQWWYCPRKGKWVEVEDIRAHWAEMNGGK